MALLTIYLFGKNDSQAYKTTRLKILITEDTVISLCVRLVPQIKRRTT